MINNFSTSYHSMGYRAIIMRKLFHWTLFLYEKSSTFIAQIKFILWGVIYGKGVRIIGRIIVFRTPESTIQIGNHCIFNSSSKLNFRGINHPCILQTGAPHAKIMIGNHVEMSGTSIVSNHSVTIGNHVLIGANCQIGDRDGHSNRYKSSPKPILIENDVWLGMNVTVLKGVTIGEHSIIGANSVVTKDIPANSIAAGNPCSVIRTINSDI